MERKLIEAYVALGDARMSLLLEINDMHASGVEIPESMVDARNRLREAHEGLKPLYERSMRSLFNDIPF